MKEGVDAAKLLQRDDEAARSKGRDRVTYGWHYRNPQFILPTTHARHQIGQFRTTRAGNSCFHAAPLLSLKLIRII